MTHASVPKDQRAVLGITDNFLRLSVGLETVEDLIEDLNQALIKAVLYYTPSYNTFKYNLLKSFPYTFKIPNV